MKAIIDEANPASVIEYIRDAYLRYYDSAFWMRDQAVMDERREILLADGVMAREPLLEAVPNIPRQTRSATRARKPSLIPSWRSTWRMSSSVQAMFG